MRNTLEFLNWIESEKPHGNGWPPIIRTEIADALKTDEYEEIQIQKVESCEGFWAFCDWGYRGDVWMNFSDALSNRIYLNAKRMAQISAAYNRVGLNEDEDQDLYEMDNMSIHVSFQLGYFAQGRGIGGGGYEREYIKLVLEVDLEGEPDDFQTLYFYDGLNNLDTLWPQVKAAMQQFFL